MNSKERAPSEAWVDTKTERAGSERSGADPEASKAPEQKPERLNHSASLDRRLEGTRSRVSEPQMTDQPQRATNDDPLCPRCQTPVEFYHGCYDSGCTVSWKCLKPECGAMGWI